MAGATYTPIATTTLSSAASTVTFSSISGAYTDLVVVGNFAVSGTTNVKLRVNSDSGSNYSITYLDGNGTSAVSGRMSNSSSFIFTPSSWYAATGFYNVLLVNLTNYSNSTTYKTILTRYGSADRGTLAIAGLWRSTSAISSLEFSTDAGLTLSSGSIFTLYGIAAA
jgi:hypothetical protein